MALLLLAALAVIAGQAGGVTVCLPPKHTTDIHAWDTRYNAFDMWGLAADHPGERFHYVGREFAGWNYNNFTDLLVLGKEKKVYWVFKTPLGAHCEIHDLSHPIPYRRQCLSQNATQERPKVIAGDVITADYHEIEVRAGEDIHRHIHTTYGEVTTPIQFNEWFVDEKKKIGDRRTETFWDFIPRVEDSEFRINPICTKAKVVRDAPSMY
eukprot:203097_1